MSTSAGSSDSDAPQQSAGRLRILQVSGSAAGGVRTHLADCARILAADGHDVIVEAPAAVGRSVRVLIDSQRAVIVTLPGVSVAIELAAVKSSCLRGKNMMRSLTVKSPA